MKDDTATSLTREAAAAHDLVAALASEDATLNHDMVEGETSFLEAVEAAISEIDDCEIISAGCKEKEKEIADRRARVEKRKDRLRGLLEQAITMSGLPTVKLPTATISVKEMPPKYMVEDETKIPEEYWKQPDPVLDRTAIGKAFKEGVAIPGIGKTNGTTQLQIRRA